MTKTTFLGLSFYVFIWFNMVLKQQFKRHKNKNWHKKYYRIVAVSDFPNHVLADPESLQYTYNTFVYSDRLVLVEPLRSSLVAAWFVTDINREK